MWRVKALWVDSLGTRTGREAASSHGACSREIVLTIDAEVTQRNFSGREQSASPLSNTRLTPQRRWRRKPCAEWRQREVSVEIAPEISTAPDESQSKNACLCTSYSPGEQISCKMIGVACSPVGNRFPNPMSKS